jgi:outer membrane receptor protein involved in Fe transport
MTTSNNAVRSAVRRALCIGAFATAASYTPVAVAQDAEAELEEITVTGTRIQRQDYSSASPISTVDASQFTNTGAPTIDSVLQTLPQFVPNITSSSNNPSRQGQANVALRGLDATRTLVLLDGRRIVPSDPDGVVDLNLIPASIIENVEVITGGASAVYGSDAIAGVVNIRTRRFTGLEVMGSYGETAESDGQRTTIGVTGGLESSDGRGYAFGSFTWSDRDGVLAGDRDFSAVALDWDNDAQQFDPVGSTTIRQGRWDSVLTNLPTQAAIDTYFAAQDPSYVAGSATPGGNFGFNPDGSIFQVSPVVNFTGDRNEPLQPVNDASYTYNFSPVNFLETPLERKTFFGKAGFEVSDSTEVWAQVLWAQYDSDQALAPTPATSLYVRPDNPNIGADLATLLASRPNPTEPFSFRKRMIESGPRISANSYNVIQTSAGMMGELPFADGWDWDLYASYGSVDFKEDQLGNISRSAWYELALADDHGASIIGQPINPFGIGSLSEAAVAHYTKTASNDTQLRQENIEGFVTGPMFSLPAGDAQAVFGLQYRRDDVKFLADSSLRATVIDPVTGSTRVDITGFNADDNIRGATESKEAYLEASFPLLGDMTAIETLELIVGYRFTDHNIAGNLNSYKGEFIWDVTSQFGFRGGFQRAVRAPNIDELFRPATKNFPAVGLGDPCSNDFTDPSGAVQGAQDNQQARDLCIAQGIPAGAIDAFIYSNSQFEGLVGGNPELFEESADTITVGAVWRGDGDGIFGNFRASLDYYDIQIDDVITNIDADVMVERCFNPSFNPDFSNDNQFCQLFSRDPALGTVIDAAEVNFNLTKQAVRGVDFQLDYGTDIGPGEFNGTFVASYLIDFEEAITSVDPLEQYAGTASSNQNVLPELKTTMILGYGIGGFDGDVRWRFIDETVDRSFPNFKLDSVNYLDVTLGYDFEGLVDGLRARVGVTNATDEQPIIFPSNQQSNTDPAQYDVLGRRWFVNLTYSF